MRVCSQMFEGYSLKARDGSIGHVKDLYINPDTWRVQYLVAQTTNWPRPRLSLVPIAAVDELDLKRRELKLDMIRYHVECGPPVKLNKPISPLYEHKYWRHFYKVPERNAEIQFAGPIVPVFLTPVTNANTLGDHRFRSLNDLRGFQLQAIGGRIGKVDDVVINCSNWTAASLVVNHRRWPFQAKSLADIQWVRRVDWKKKEVQMEILKEAVESFSPFGHQTHKNEADEAVAVDYMGRPLPADEIHLSLKDA